MEAGGRFTPRARDGMVSGDAEHTSHSPLVPTRTIVLEMNGLRELRHSVGRLQEEFAALLGVPLETFRTWDSGRRPLPPPILQRARAAVADHARRTELLPVPVENSIGSAGKPVADWYALTVQGDERIGGVFSRG